MPGSLGNNGNSNSNSKRPSRFIINWSEVRHASGIAVVGAAFIIYCLLVALNIIPLGV